MIRKTPNYDVKRGRQNEKFGAAALWADVMVVGYGGMPVRQTAIAGFIKFFDFLLTFF